MKTAKELIEKLKTDEAFAKEFAQAFVAKLEAGAENNSETLITTANESGYELAEADISEVMKSQAEDSEVSEEELGKVAGGTLIAFIIGCAGVSAVTGFAGYGTYKMLS